MMQVKRIDPRENTNYTGSVATQSRPISSTNSPHPTINRASSFFGLKDSNLEEPSAQIVLEKRVETLKQLKMQMQQRFQNCVSNLQATIKYKEEENLQLGRTVQSLQDELRQLTKELATVACILPNRKLLNEMTPKSSHDLKVTEGRSVYSRNPTMSGKTVVPNSQHDDKQSTGQRQIQKLLRTQTREQRIKYLMRGGKCSDDDEGHSVYRSKCARGQLRKLSKDSKKTYNQLSLKRR